ncbi:hypothetical protein PIB30_005068 [Stylosanthes scabra]|uniref:Heat shock 70 kDa protein 16 n=1 Tax=Stylosanthes scabra TaxID=79078 RepID=A0ABU6Z1S5_9FABA|nr:hypothetical protein [Stylosanthes scabra]
MSVVGFDIGNENCVIAVVKQGGVDVLLNEESKRETPAVVCFGEKQRFLGSSGAASAMMHPKSTVSQVKRLIGRKFSDPDVQKDLKMLPVETSEGPDGGILIHLKYLKENHRFTPVQILAMLFSHLKTIAEKDLGMPVSDCVIGVPSYFSDSQRRAYLNAAAIVGLKPLRLIHDCTATGIGYGIYKADFRGAAPIYVAFVDIGHCDTQVSIAAFQAGKMKMLSHAFDWSLGGRDFDEVLFSYFAAKFREQYSIDVYSNARACIRLRSACEKLKKVLSANAEAPLNIECLMDEKDVKGIIKREEFEKLASGLLERIRVPCNKALADAGLTVEKIHSVELVGSGSRIPAITRLLTSLSKREPSRTLNASECVARGCALQCAMLSPALRVKEYKVQDCSPFSVGLSSEEGPISAEPKGVIFPKGQPIPTVKTLTFRFSNLLRLEAFYANSSELPPGMSPKISRFTIGFHGYHSIRMAEVKVGVQLNLHGIVSIKSARVITTGNHHSDSKGMEVEHISGEDNNAFLQAGSTGKDNGNKKLHVLVSEDTYGGMTKAEISEAEEKEIRLAQQDTTMELTKEKRNALESYIYETRTKLFNTYRSFGTEEERDRISRSLRESEEWLYGDGDDETVHAYSAILEDLRQLVNPVENRYKDEAARVEAMRDLLSCIVKHRASADSLPPEHKEQIINECDKAEQWLREKMQQQDNLPKTSDLVFWSSDIKSKAEELKLVCQQILENKDT